MRVRQIRAENYRGFVSLDFELPTAGPVVFVGENGSGKSSLIRLVEVAIGSFPPHGERRPRLDSFDQRRPDARLDARVEFDSGAHWRIQSETDWPLDGTANIGPNDRSPSRFMHLTADFGRYEARDFLRWFRETEDVENEVRLRNSPEHRDPALEAVRRALAMVVGALPDACVETPRFSRVGRWANSNGGTFVVSKRGVDLGLQQLSSGESAVLVIVGEIARRLAGRARGEGDPLHGEGIVLIDEVDAHLHPRWQRSIVNALCGAFPNVQFIVTTHSPVVLGMIDRAQIVRLRDFEVIPTPPTFGRDSTTVLEDVMALPAHGSEIQSVVDGIAAAIDADDYDAARRALAGLEAAVGDDHPEVVRYATTLEFLDAP